MQRSTDNNIKHLYKYIKKGLNIKNDKKKCINQI